MAGAAVKGPPGMAKVAPLLSAKSGARLGAVNDADTDEDVKMLLLKKGGGHKNGATTTADNATAEKLL